MFEQALKLAVAKLHSAQSKGALASFAIIGGFAVARWGRPRATADIDFALKLGNSSLEELATLLKGEYRSGSHSDPLQGSVTFLVRAKQGEVPIQLLQFPPSWEKVAFHRVEQVPIAGIPMPFVGWQGLVLLKLYAGSALDLEDARSILTNVSPTARERANLEKQASSLRVSRRLEKIKTW